MTRVELIVIAGPTATGKTRIGVELAHRLGTEILSADSRQVYRGLDIGSGKDLREYSAVDLEGGAFVGNRVEARQVPGGDLRGGVSELGHLVDSPQSSS